MDYVDFFDAETDNILASMDENVCFQVDNKAVANEKCSENRFPELTEDEVDSLYAKASCNNTNRTTKTWLNTYISWAKLRSQRQDIENLSPRELNSVLGQFYAELKKINGEDYQPESLAVMQASLDRHLKEKGYTLSIVRDPQFHSSNKILRGKATKLREEGKGSRPNASKALTWQEEAELWKAGKLGDHDPETLIHTVWFTLTQHMGLRGRQEHALADIDDFIFGKDENDVDYVQFNDLKPTKTRQGGLRMKRRGQLPKMFATNDSTCPVAIFRSYLSHRPEKLKMSGPLYLAVKYKPKTKVWYKAQKMGTNRLGEIMKRIVRGTAVEQTGKRLTNHSARKTVVKKLDDANIPRAQIVSVTGHRNEKSLDDYVDSFSTERSKQLSNIISGSETVNTLSGSHKVGPLQIRDGNNSLPSTSAPPNAVPQRQFPVLNLSNLAQNMENSTINVTVNNNIQMPPSYFDNRESEQSCSSAAAKRRRVLPFYDSDSD